MSRFFARDDELLSRSIFDDATTLFESFRRGARPNDDGRALGYRKGDQFHWISYTEVRWDWEGGLDGWMMMMIDDVQAIDRSVNVARGFLELGMVPGQNTHIGIYSKNRPEVWYLVVS